MTLPNIYWKCRNFKPETFLSDFEMPQVQTRCLAHASRIEARAIVVLGVHHGAFRQKELCSRDVAIFRLVQRRVASGGFSGKPSAAVGFRRTTARRPRRGGWRTEVVGSWALCPFNRQTNDECFWLNSFELCKAKYIHTQSQTHRTSFMAFWCILFPTNYIQWNAVYYQ